MCVRTLVCIVHVLCIVCKEHGVMRVFSACVDGMRAYGIYVVCECAVSVTI